MTNKKLDTAVEVESVDALVAARLAELTKDSLLEALFDGPIDKKRIGVHDPIGNGEEIIDELNELECRLRALGLKYGKLGGAMRLKAEYDAESREEELMLVTQAQSILDAGKALIAIVWSNIRMRLNVGHEYGIGIREGIKFVQFKHKDEMPNIGKLLAKKLIELSPDDLDE